ncbi:hypothetical protein CMI37_35455 [Candidatus Pacearchaeota archaeon]|nr:hypothetical protein [Candidatus Pacearchaeota archaeon]
MARAVKGEPPGDRQPNHKEPRPAGGTTRTGQGSGGLRGPRKEGVCRGANEGKGDEQDGARLSHAPEVERRGKDEESGDDDERRPQVLSPYLLPISS